MKYAIINLRGAIIKISDVEPLAVSQNTVVKEITDDQFSIIESGLNSFPRILYSFYDNELITFDNKLRLQYINSMSIQQKIQEGKKFVTNAGFGADEKVICLNKLLKIKEAGLIAGYPKLTASYAWLETVQIMALNGQMNFPPAPFTFEEVVAE